MPIEKLERNSTDRDESEICTKILAKSEILWQKIKGMVGKTEKKENGIIVEAIIIGN